MAKVGFIGTGIMGAPMVLNLLSTGHIVKVWNRTPAKLEKLVKAGAIFCKELNAIGDDVEFLFCMLSDGQTCDEILFKDGGAISSLSLNSTVIVMSSIPVEVAKDQYKKCQDLGLNYLDAPVSGGEKGAIQGDLAIMVGGDKETFDLAKDLFDSMGRATLVGEAGCGALAKLVNQMIVATTIAAVSEGFLLAKQGGANLQKVQEALTGGFADSPILQQHGTRMLTQNFKPGGMAKTQLKDTRMAKAYAELLDLNLPILKKVNQLFTELVESGYGELDHSALIIELQRQNKLALSSEL